MTSVSSEDFVTHGVEWNVQWLKDHPGHYLYSTWQLLHKFDKRFAETSCEVTAAMIRSKITPDFGEWWQVSQQHPDHLPICQVIFGEDAGDVQHIITKMGSTCIQSHWSLDRTIYASPWESELLAEPFFVWVPKDVNESGMK